MSDQPKRPLHHHLCTDESTLLSESHCKYYKRLLVGIIRYMGGRLSIPGEFFDNVDMNDGFEVEPDETYVLRLTSEWKYNQDDCGHEVTENAHFSAEPERPNLVVLKHRSNG